MSQVDRGAPKEEEAWAAVLAAWGDEAAHRAYLSRLSDLEGLARAGARYRAVLAERPGDPVATRFRDEIVKRATVVGLSSLPRTAPPPPREGLRRKLVIAASISLGSAAVWAAWRLYQAVTGNPP
ncbi:MAG TPA: hypothetical protein VML50_08175 [Anaeromyxobacter sp.]|nr:hypothetical protein [Anaeromyxobacter sp.]